MQRSLVGHSSNLTLEVKMRNHYLLLIFFSLKLFGMDIGSDTAVTRFNTQITLNNGDRIAGFAALDGGFFIDSANVTATFDSFFQVSGPLAFNGGTLNLSQDLSIANVASITSLGNIVGDFHTMDLGRTVTMLPLASEVVPCELTFIDNATGVDPFETVDWAFDSVYIGVGTSGFQPNVIVYEFDGSVLTQVEIITPPGFSFDVNVVRWHPSDYFLAVGIGAAFFGGSELHIYSFDPGTTTLTLISSNVVPGAVTALAWHPDGDNLVVGTDVTASEVQLYPVSGTGVLGAPVNINIAPNRDVQLESADFDSTGDYFAVGLNANAADPTLLVYDFTKMPLGAVLNASVTTAVTVAGLSWNQTITNLIAVGQTGTSTDRVIAYEHDGGGGTLTQVAAVSDFSIGVENVAWNPEGDCLALGTVIDAGVGQVRSYCYDDATEMFDFANSFNLASNVGGIGWSVDNAFLATGDDSDTLSVYRTADNTTIESFMVSNLVLLLNNGLMIDDAAIIFNGNATIEGQGNTLDLMGTSTFIIDRNSSLSLKNVVLQGAGLQNISGVDSTSTLTCENVRWSLDTDFTFTQGALFVVSQLILEGEQKLFTFQTDAPATIEPFSSITVDNGVTFSYDPSIANKNLLLFSDSTSCLRLIGGTLHASATGLNLLKGSLCVDNNSSITSDGVVDNEAIAFGDGVASSNNFNINIDPAALLELVTGRVLYNNV